MQERVRARVRVEVEEVARHPPWPVEEAPRAVEYTRAMILGQLGVDLGPITKNKK